MGSVILGNHLTTTKQLAEQTKYITFAPARRSSMALVSKDLKKYLPTNPENMKNALQTNAKWWADNDQALKQRFDDWVKTPTQKGIAGAPR
ncbi:hypothetical protein QUF75_04390 [Desulfococcaceae bacterium HSG7]|nr:hypothetical protein [Desulfococcaceae bacterium HSG7]